MSALAAAFAESGHAGWHANDLGNMRANGVWSPDVSCWQIGRS
jgi:hypothetical protein